MVGNHPSVKGGITSVISQLLDHNWNKDGVDMKFISTYIEAGTIKKSLYFFAVICKDFLGDDDV
jgi:hypothetical protein